MAKTTLQLIAFEECARLAFFGGVNFPTAELAFIPDKHPSLGGLQCGMQPRYRYRALGHPLHPRSSLAEAHHKKPRAVYSLVSGLAPFDDRSSGEPCVRPGLEHTQ